jgi:hypothetical protein
MLSIGLWPWYEYIDIPITILDTIHRPEFYLTTTFRRQDSVSVFRWNLLQMGPTGAATRYIFLCAFPMYSSQHTLSNFCSHTRRHALIVKFTSGASMSQEINLRIWRDCLLRWWCTVRWESIDVPSASKSGRKETEVCLLAADFMKEGSPSTWALKRKRNIQLTSWRKGTR